MNIWMVYCDLGGSQVIVCSGPGGCGSYVKLDGWDQHLAWHSNLEVTDERSLQAHSRIGRTGS